MKIAVESIPAAGRQVAFNATNDWARGAASLSLDRPPTILEGLFQLKRAKNGVVVVDLTVKAEADAACDRCGEECSIALAIDTRLLYAPEESGGEDYDGLSLDSRKDFKMPTSLEQAEEEDSVELDEQDLDVGWYRRGEIALDDVLSEALALAAPPRIVCADTVQCDRRTSALLSAAVATDGGPFAALGVLKRPVGEG